MEPTARTAVLSPSYIRKSELSIPKMFRDLSAVGIIFISILPEASSRYIFAPLFVLWVLFAAISNIRAFNRSFVTPNIKSYSVYIWLLTYFIFYITGYMQGADVGRLLNYMRLGFSMLLFNYYLEANDLKAVKKLTIFSLVFIVLTCITTLRGLALDPMAARVLATGREELMQGLEGLAIGSFGFVYGLVFAAVAILGSIKAGTLEKHKIIFTALIALFVYTIFSAAFMMALLLLAVSVVLLLLNIKKTSYLIIAAFGILVLFIVFSSTISDFLNFLGNTVQHESLSMRFYELAIMASEFSVDGTVNAEGRWGFLALSIGSFLSSPFLGVGGSYGFGASLHGIGGHSAFFDELAKYGILGSGFLFVALYSNAQFVYRRLKSGKQRMVYYCSMTAFFLLGFINTMLFVPIFFMAYFVVPGIIYSLTKDENGRSELNENTLVR